MRSFNHARVITLLCVAASLAAPAQTFKTMVNFNFGDGAYPQYMTLAQGRDGNMWGTTASGGVAIYGTAFRMTPGGELTKVFNFDSAYGTYLYAGLVLGRDNDFYGVTSSGGTYSAGTVFTLSPTGSLTVLSAFDGTNGLRTIGALTQGTDGNFYGTTSYGGNNSCLPPGCGTIFKITPSGTLTTLYEFDGPHGANPYGGLVQATDGNFYGTTFAGGTSTNCYGNAGCGTVFSLTPAGVLTVLYRFSSSDGAGPDATLVQGSDGSFYGTTEAGGANGVGTVFVITRAGSLTSLHNFSRGADGFGPIAPLVEGTDRNFYSTTFEGGSSGLGTVFQITPSGTLTTLHTFSGSDGAAPASGLVQHTNGLFYGTTESGGTATKGICGPTNGCGTVFSLDMGLGPFIKTTTTLGKVGSRVQILGTGLTGSTSVTFNGTSATTFTIDGDTYMTAIVPTGATTGPRQVTTPTGTLSSNVNFRVAP